MVKRKPAPKPEPQQSTAPKQSAGTGNAAERLGRYQAKRDFTRTPEPSGGPAPKGWGARSPGRSAFQPRASSFKFGISP